MKRLLLVLATAVLFVNALATPTFINTDGGAGGTNCGQTMCKP